MSDKRVILRQYLNRLSILVGILCLIIAGGSSGCQGEFPPGDSGLILEEFLLEGLPDPDRGTFLPVNTTQDAVLERHQTERELWVFNEISYSEEIQSVLMISQGPGPSLEAVLVVSPDNPLRQIVELLEGDEVIFSVDGGLPSPALPMQSLWSYEDHWALEILYAEEEIWQGRIYLDGELLNESWDYQEAFGFQLLDGKPFYFFQREDGLGYSYDGKETALPYDTIPHYNCCSASTINPLPAEKMVAFYALTADDWYYVELGGFQVE